MLEVVGAGMDRIRSRIVALVRQNMFAFIGGILELAEPGPTCWLVPVDAVDELAGVVRVSFDTPRVQLTDTGRAGRVQVLADHDARRETGRPFECLLVRR